MNTIKNKKEEILNLIEKHLLDGEYLNYWQKELFIKIDEYVVLKQNNIK